LEKISAFQGLYRFLSNFWPCYLVYEGLLFPTVEHAYQAAKIGDLQLKNDIRNCPTPAAAKDFFDTHPIQADAGWTIEKKLAVMEDLLNLKFGGNHPLLTRALLATGDAELIEGNSWNDTFWGVCNNEGENQLGKLLMKTRSALKAQKQEILHALEAGLPNKEIAVKMDISERSLYEKMISFEILNREYWIS
jgi:ribA/ribD-fused uncharacterized protein